MFSLFIVVEKPMEQQQLTTVTTLFILQTPDKQTTNKFHGCKKDPKQLIVNSRHWKQLPFLLLNSRNHTWLSKRPKTTMLCVVGLLFVLLLMAVLFVCYKRSFATTMSHQLQRQRRKGGVSQPLQLPCVYGISKLKNRSMMTIITRTIIITITNDDNNHKNSIITRTIVITIIITIMVTMTRTILITRTKQWQQQEGKQWHNNYDN